MERVGAGCGRGEPARHRSVRARAQRGGFTHGDDGGSLRWRWCGFAKDTYAEYPPGALAARHGNFPKLRHLLAVCTRNSGRVELGGHAAGPQRQDEGIVADRVYLFTDAPDGADAGGRRRTTSASSAPSHRPTRSVSWMCRGFRVRRRAAGLGVIG
ncbi:hypothetical protein ACVBEQ_26405 [Nakamurella sp. GG22]